MAVSRGHGMATQGEGGEKETTHTQTHTHTRTHEASAPLERFIAPVFFLFLCCFVGFEMEKDRSPSQTGEGEVPAEAQDLTLFVQSVLEQMVSGLFELTLTLTQPQKASKSSNAYHACLVLPQQTRFTQMSESIIGRVDEMGARIDELEKSIQELVEQTGTSEDGKTDG